MAVRAAASPRTLNAMMRALDAAASVTSDSVRPPTPEATMFTATSPVDSAFSASRNASTLPCTSALTKSCTMSAFLSPMVQNPSGMLALFCASLTSRDLDWRCIATSRALRSLSTTSNSSPAFGAPDKPSTTTGIDGPAASTGCPASSNYARTRPELLPDQQGIAQLEGAAQHQHRGDGAAALLEARLDHVAGRETGGGRFQFKHFRLQQDAVEQLIHALPGPRRHRHEDV